MNQESALLRRAECQNRGVLMVCIIVRRFLMSTDLSLSVLKFSSEDCGICHKMAFYDQKVAEELGLAFVDIKMQDTVTYRKYRQILLAQYPDKAEMGWPTYLICEDPEGEFKIIGEVKGGHPKGEFRSRLQEVIGAES
jgi:hypothetical protein